MRQIIFKLVLLFGAAVSFQQAFSKSLFDFEVKTIEGKAVSLADYKTKSKAFLIVNTASECGYTGQYEGLQNLHKTYSKKGLVVMAFPSNDFGGQEPGSDQKIKKFCKLNYGVSFPLFSKGPVKGEKAQPLFQWLTKSKGPIKWNFEKFLLNAEGQLVGRFQSGVTPESEELKKAISKELGAKPTKTKKKKNRAARFTLLYRAPTRFGALS